MSYRMEQLVLWEITATSLDTIILHQNTAGVFIVFWEVCMYGLEFYSLQEKKIIWYKVYEKNIFQRKKYIPMKRMHI